MTIAKHGAAIRDDRQYGSDERRDRRGRRCLQQGRQAADKVLKIALPVTTYAEYAAMKCTGQLIDAVENAELRQGYLAQMIDEVRHTNQEAHLIRYLCRAPPRGTQEGFDPGLSHARDQSHHPGKPQCSGWIFCRRSRLKAR